MTEASLLNFASYFLLALHESPPGPQCLAVERMIADGWLDTHPEVSDLQGKPLLFYALERGHDFLVTILIQHPSQRILTDSRGNTALHLAVQLRQLDDCQLLLDHGFDFLQGNFRGESAMDHATMHGDRDILDLFEKEKAKRLQAHLQESIPTSPSEVLHKPGRL